MQEYARYPPTLKKVYWRERKKEGSKFSTAQHSKAKQALGECQEATWSPGCPLFTVCIQEYQILDA